MKITVRKVSGSEVQVIVSADIQISGDLAELLGSGPYQGLEGAGASDRGGGVPELLTVEQAAEVLNISRDHVYGLIRTGQLRSIKIGKPSDERHRATASPG